MVALKNLLHYLLTLILIFSPLNGLAQTQGEIRYQANDLEFYDGYSWNSMNASDSSESCTSDNPGEIRFNATPNPDRMEFCDGSTWRTMDHEVTAVTCTTAGEIEWDNAYYTLRYCNGTHWVKVSAGLSYNVTVF